MVNFLEAHLTPLDPGLQHRQNWICAGDPSISASGALSVLQYNDPLQGWAPPTRVWSLLLKLASPGKHDLNPMLCPRARTPQSSLQTCSEACSVRGGLR